MRSLRDEVVDFAALAVELVSEFHRTFGHPVRLTPTAISQREADLRAALLTEEAAEYGHALLHRDIVGMADGLGDIVVVAAGSALTYGSSLPDDVRDVWAVPPLPLAVEGAVDPFLGREDAGEALARVVWAAYGEALARWIPLERVLRAIHASNMSKLDADGSVIRREDGKILKGPNFRPPELRPVLVEAGLLPIAS